LTSSTPSSAIFCRDEGCHARKKSEILQQLEKMAGKKEEKLPTSKLLAREQVSTTN